MLQLHFVHEHCWNFLYCAQTRTSRPVVSVLDRFEDPIASFQSGSEPGDEPEILSEGEVLS